MTKFESARQSFNERITKGLILSKAAERLRAAFEAVEGEIEFVTLYTDGNIICKVWTHSALVAIQGLLKEEFIQFNDEIVKDRYDATIEGVGVTVYVLEAVEPATEPVTTSPGE